MNLTYTNDNQELVIKKDKNSGCFMHFHKMVEIMYYIDGTHYATINNETAVMTADDISVCNKLDIHKFTSPNQGNLIMLQINNFLLQSFYSLYPTKNRFQHFLTDKNKNRALLPILEKLLATSNEDPLLQVALINELLSSLIKLYKLKPTEDTSKIQETLIYINEHCHENLSRDGIAKKFGYNPSYFSTFFKKYMGLSFGDYLNLTRYNLVNARIHNNPQRLKKTHIILTSGFQSTLNYYRFAKKFKSLNDSLDENINQTIRE